jgi:hypothetical protein
MPVIAGPDRRREPRTQINLGLFVWGIETKGNRFLQEVHAEDISLSGALLSGFETDVHCGDLVGILYLGKEARFRVVWVRCGDQGYGVQAAVRRVESDACPWQDLLGTRDLAQAAGMH